MNAYRLTRNQPYLNPKCEGHTDLEDRSTCHLLAESEQDVIAQMEHLFPLDTAGFTCELWTDYPAQQ